MTNVHVVSRSPVSPAAASAVPAEMLETLAAILRATVTPRISEASLAALREAVRPEISASVLADFQKINNEALATSTARISEAALANFRRFNDESVRRVTEQL